MGTILQWPMDDKVLKSTVEFTLTQRGWAYLLCPGASLQRKPGSLESILDLSGGTAWTWSSANWRGKGPRFFVDLLCLWLLKHQQHNVSCLEAFQLPYLWTCQDFSQFCFAWSLAGSWSCFHSWSSKLACGSVAHWTSRGWSWDGLVLCGMSWCFKFEAICLV